MPLSVASQGLAAPANRSIRGDKSKQQEEQVSRIQAGPELVRHYSRLFVNRRAYTLQSLHPHPESGRHYYFRPQGRDGRPASLTKDTLCQHLEGEVTVGL